MWLYNDDDDDDDDKDDVDDDEDDDDNTNVLWVMMLPTYSVRQFKICT
ncbi:unnamed protein product [Enterobius vermicularis]|uniref:Uncharacterized protein n=1 Tax=Enterobius vermicularis TaxID=51028 RepID=A0A0N4VRS4_ENTVE|nr:unnamed protein product [Enterobius vermicularis]